METVTCLRPKCGTVLSRSDFVCPTCNDPRPRISAYSRDDRRDDREDGEINHHSNDPCDHGHAPPGAITCPACGAPTHAAGTGAYRQRGRYRIGAPWGEFLLQETETDIGREVGPLTQYLQAHLTVSRRHASLRVTSSGRLFVIDNNSSNGTFKNMKRIPPNFPTELREGDTVSFSQSLTCSVHEDEVDR